MTVSQEQYYDKLLQLSKEAPESEKKVDDKNKFIMVSNEIAL